MRVSTTLYSTTHAQGCNACPGLTVFFQIFVTVFFRYCNLLLNVLEIRVGVDMIFTFFHQSSQSELHLTTYSVRSKLGLIIRLPIPITTITNCSWQNQIAHGKTKKVKFTATQNSSRQNHKLSSRQNQIVHSKTKKLAAKPNSSGKTK